MVEIHAGALSPAPRLSHVAQWQQDFAGRRRPRAKDTRGSRPSRTLVAMSEKRHTIGLNQDDWERFKKIQKRYPGADTRIGTLRAMMSAVETEDST